MKGLTFLLIALCGAFSSLLAQPTSDHFLRFDTLPTRWDEAFPLGNGQLGALVWQKEGKLRLSLDRADLWDDRPMPEIHKLTFATVVRKVQENDYAPIQQLGDAPYENSPAPSKLPGAALVFDIHTLGNVSSAELNIAEAITRIRFAGGTEFTTFVHAEKSYGYFEWTNLPASIVPQLIPPDYNTGRTGTAGNSVDGQSLERLGYPKGTITQSAGNCLYHQPTWDGTYYEVRIHWTYTGQTLAGWWTISNNKPAKLPSANSLHPDQAIHLTWWKKFWAASAITLPDTILERQYYLDMYKLGCVARSNTPAITLQAVWTADNGSLPPWKGDFHHDLNTQLSYWPTYAGNRLEQAASFTNWLWSIRQEARKYTEWYFQKPGLNVPGVSTISGKAMGGWIQYSMASTISAWLAQHFYWEWKYRMDPVFLRTRAYPWIHETAVFLEHITQLDATGKRKLPLSSSPEYHDNSIHAWFADYTNHDLALIHFAFKAAADVALATGKTKEAAHWQMIRAQLPALHTNETGLTIAPGQNLTESHRHHAHLISIYPLGILNPDIKADSTLIAQSLISFQNQGTRSWTGYSFAWAASIYAQARQAEKAVQALRIFAENFVSSNTFHLNGDQRGGQYSSFTYRPFTLEGNFAFAQGVHEILLQSDKGYIEVFPAIPSSWKDVQFKDLRAQGAFLVSATKEQGVIRQIELYSKKGGLAQLKLPQPALVFSGSLQDGLLKLPLRPAQRIILVCDPVTNIWTVQ